LSAFIPVYGLAYSFVGKRKTVAHIANGDDRPWPA